MAVEYADAQSDTQEILKSMLQPLLLMKNTSLSLEEIAAMLGYSKYSNFNKAYYGTKSREYSASLS